MSKFHQNKVTYVAGPGTYYDVKRLRPRPQQAGSYLEWPKIHDCYRPLYARCVELDADNSYKGNDLEKGKSWGGSKNSGRWSWGDDAWQTVPQAAWWMITVDQQCLVYRVFSHLVKKCVDCFYILSVGDYLPDSVNPAAICSDSPVDHWVAFPSISRTEHHSRVSRWLPSLHVGYTADGCTHLGIMWVPVMPV